MKSLLCCLCCCQKSSSDDEEDNEKKFQTEALKAHNVYRANHGVELLKLDKKVSIHNVL